MVDRPTKRERKDEAKKRRLEEMRRRQRRARVRRLYTWGTLAAVIAAGVIVGVMQGSANARKKSAAAKLAAAAGCEAPKEYPSEGRDHINPPQIVNYKTDPPTSGNHYNVQTAQVQAPAPTGVHTAPIQNEAEVHNLEHGHILIQYRPGTISADLLKKLETIVNKDPQWTVLAPRDNKNTNLALTAWTIKQSCETPNANVVKVVDDFIKRFKNQGPESIPGTPQGGQQ